jgi:hypothetical protein
MADTMQKTQTVGGITKVYVIRDGVLGNVSGSNFYKLSDYELQHDVSNVKRDAAGKITFYTLSGADAAQYAASQAAKAAAAKAAQEAAAKAAAANAAQKIDPQKTSGYAFKYAMSHSDQNNYVRAKQSNSSLTEYQWRKQNGKDLTVVKGSYVAPKITSSNKSAATTGTKSTGVSNTKTGSEKIAAQSKTNASTNKAVVKSTTKTTTPTKPKTTVSLDAAKSGNASKTTSTKTVVTTKQAASGNAAKTTPTKPKTTVTTKQASSGNAAKTTSTTKKVVSTATASNGTVAKNTASTASSGSGAVKKVTTPVSTKPQKSATYIPVVRSATGVIISQQNTKTDPNAARNTTGLSNKLTGSEKIAAQGKGTNKAIIINRSEAPKTVVSIAAAKSGNAAATTPKPAIIEPKTKVVVSLAAAASGNAAKTVPKSANQAVQYVIGAQRTGLSIPMAEMTSGSQKLAAQRKINASTNKPTIIKKPVQPVITKKPTMQLTPFDSTATPVIVKKPAATPIFANTTVKQTTPKKKSVFSTVSSLFGPDKSGFGIVGIASGKITAEDRMKYTQDSRFKPCPTGLCSIKWTNDQITKLKAEDARAAQTQTTQTTQTTQKPQTQTTQKPQTQTKTTQKTQTITQTQVPVQTQVPIESQPTEIRVTRQREDPQWHEAVQNILKQDMMARYGLDSRGNKIVGSNTSTLTSSNAGTPIKLSGGSSIEQVQKVGNSRDSNVKILAADSRITAEQRNELYQQKLAGNYNPTAVKVKYVSDGKNKITHGTVTNQLKADLVAEAKAASKAARAEQARRQEEYLKNITLDKNNIAINVITDKNNQATISRNVAGQTVTISSPLGASKAAIEQKNKVIYDALV